MTQEKVLSTFMAAVEGTIVILATPTIARDLSGFAMISLVFSVYLLAAAKLINGLNYLIVHHRPPKTLLMAMTTMSRKTTT